MIICQLNKNNRALLFNNNKKNFYNFQNIKRIDLKYYFNNSYKEIYSQKIRNINFENKNKNINQDAKISLIILKKQSMGENYSEINPKNNFSMKEENFPESRMNDLYFKNFKNDNKLFKYLQTITNTGIFILLK